MIISFYITISLIIGWCLRGIFIKILERIKNEQLKSQSNDTFNEILNNILNGRSSFRTRINNTVYINMTLKDYGDVNIVYLLDKNDIGVLKNTNVVITTTIVDKEIIRKIINAIKEKFNNEINDVIEMLGFVFSKNDFEKTFGIKAEDLKKGKIKEKSEIEKIVTENDKKFNIDDILDKINKVGIENLTPEENKFLNNFNK